MAELLTLYMCDVTKTLVTYEGTNPVGTGFTIGSLIIVITSPGSHLIARKQLNRDSAVFVN